MAADDDCCPAAARPLRRRASRLVSAALCAVALVGGLLAQAGTASADVVPPASLTILSPAVNATLAGTVTVSVRLEGWTADDDSSIWFSVGGIWTMVDVDEQACQTSCVLSTDLDTVSPFGSGPQLQRDGLTTVEVSLRDHVDFSDLAAHRSVTVNNHRPTLTVHLPPVDEAVSPDDPYYPLIADKTLTVSATAAATSPGATAKVWSGVYPAGAAWAAPAIVGGPWTYTRDTSTSSPGRGGLTFYAVDSRGVMSLPESVGYYIEHEFGLAAPVFPSPVSDALGTVTLTWAYPSAISGGYPVKALTFVDGRQTSTEVFWDRRSGTLPVGLGERLAPGHHTLSWKVLDNRGLWQETSTEVDAVQTVFLDWATKPPATMVAGTSLAVAASARSTTGGLRRWEVLVDGSAVTWGGDVSNECPRDCPLTLTPEARLRLTTPGLHRVAVTIYPSDGYSMSLTSTVRVLPVARGTLSAHGAVTYGHRFTLTGRVRGDDGRALAGVPAVLQRRVFGTSTWTTASKVTSNTAGNVSFSLTGSAGSSYRIVTPAGGGRWGAATGAAITVPVRSSVRITSTPHRIKRAKRFTVAGYMTPFESGLKATLQYNRGGRWHTSPTVRVSASGKATFTIKASSHRTRKYSFRIHRPSTTRVQGGWSGVRTVRGG